MNVSEPIAAHDEYERRQQKRKDLLAAGVSVYPSRVQTRTTIREFLEHFAIAQNTSPVLITTLCGRVRLKRQHGKITFGKIEDATGSLQIVFTHHDLNAQSYTALSESLDLGDIIEVTGSAFLTKKEEPSLKATSWRFLAKGLRPLPAKWHGLEDQEERLRRRYLDLIMNPDVRKLFQQRARFIQQMRHFLEEYNFMQVSIPVLEPIAGGAEAKPFVTHHNTLDIPLYLRISLELYQKRLLVGGFEKIYEIGPVFRNEGMDREHLQEFLMMECYWAYTNYEQMMRLVEEMYTHVIQKTFGTLDITSGETTLHFQSPWPRYEYRDLLLKHAGIDITRMHSVKALQHAMTEQHLDITFPPHLGLGRMIDQLYKKFVRPQLIQPCFLIHHPVAVSPLAKRREEEPQLTERFQVVMAGVEVGNGFSELNDPVDQRERFEEQQRLKEKGDEEAQSMDEDFVEALEYGMPPASGFGVGIDRLFMICANQNSIRDVVFFPTMRPRA